MPRGSKTVPKRPRRFRMKRLMGAYRLGDVKPRREALARERLTLELAGESMKEALRLAEAAGEAGEDVRILCARLLERALESESIRVQLAEVEEKRGGPLEGLNAVAEDPGYLAEWSARSSARDRTPPEVDYHVERAHASLSIAMVGRNEDDLARDARLEALRAHAGLVEIDDRAPPARGFVPTLRRGEDVAPADADALLAALDDVEVAVRARSVIDRRIAFALHRLAFESQVLHTDAFPGRFGAATIALLVDVQERVDRILSGTEIRYEQSPRPDAAGEIAL